MRTSVLLAACLLAAIALFDLTNSTFTSTGALTLTIPALTTGAGLTGAQAAALGLGAAGLVGAAALGIALGVAANSGGSGGGSSRRKKNQRSRKGRDVDDEQVEETDFVFKVTNMFMSHAPTPYI